MLCCDQNPSVRWVSNPHLLLTVQVNAITAMFDRRQDPQLVEPIIRICISIKNERLNLCEEEEGRSRYEQKEPASTESNSATHLHE